jgi:sec-independent protein translocase protein TatB
MFGINGSEFIILMIVVVVVIGPERMPEYAAKLARLVRQLRGMADAAQAQLREQLGPEFDDVDWKQYDLRQYDPRRIVREALAGDGPDNGQASPPGAAEAGGFKRSSSFKGHDPDRPTPYDQEAT